MPRSSWSPVSFALLFLILTSGVATAEEGSFALPSGLGETTTCSVSGDADRVAIAGVQNDTAGEKYGYVCVFDRDAAGAFTHEQTLRAGDAAANSLFGHAVAVSGNTLVVSALGDSSFEGAVYVFEYDSGTWSETAKLTASDGASLDFFGGSVDCSEDRIVVGAWGENTNGAVSGAVYVFERDGTSWTEDTKLTVTGGSAGDAFGKAVALSGSTIVVGAPDANDHAGAAYVFADSEGGWAVSATLTTGSSGDFFGTSVDVQGSTALVGAPGADTPLKDSGSVYVFEESEGAWSQEQHLTAPQAGGDGLGTSVSLSGNVAVGAAPANRSAGTGASSCVIWTRPNSTSAWTLDRRCTVSGTGAGTTVTLSGSDAVPSPSATATSASTFDAN